MVDKVVAIDPVSGLALILDERDPPRYYLRLRNRLDLVSIGDAALALSQFSRKKRVLRQRVKESPSRRPLRVPRRVPVPMFASAEPGSLASQMH